MQKQHTLSEQMMLTSFEKGKQLKDISPSGSLEKINN